MIFLRRGVFFLLFAGFVFGAVFFVFARFFMPRC